MPRNRPEDLINPGEDLFEGRAVDVDVVPIEEDPGEVLGEVPTKVVLIADSIVTAVSVVESWVEQVLRQMLESGHRHPTAVTARGRV